MYKEQRQKEMRETLRQTDKVSWSLDSYLIIMQPIVFLLLARW